MVLPLLIRVSEEALRATPPSYRQAAAALGLSQGGFLRRVLVPAAAPGIAAALILSVGRALAESAALLFTAGYVTRLPDSVFDSGRALAVHIYDLSMNVAGGEGGAAATAVVLVGLLRSSTSAHAGWDGDAQDAARMKVCEPAAPAGIRSMRSPSGTAHKSPSSAPPLRCGRAS